MNEITNRRQAMREANKSVPAFENDLECLYRRGFFSYYLPPTGFTTPHLACPFRLANKLLGISRGIHNTLGMPVVYAECGADGWHLWCYDLGAMDGNGPANLRFDQFAEIGDVLLAVTILFRRIDCWSDRHVRYRTDNRPMHDPNDRPLSYSQEALIERGAPSWPDDSFADFEPGDNSNNQQ